jgi:beta-galactosidase
MRIGADYYPEHWPQERWETDATLMERAGFNVVRLAEFAWAFMEPQEHRFSFDLMDEALATLARHGVSAILGTPTGVMPAWVARKYPECLATDRNGQRLTWGVRKNNCFSAGTYRLLSERITRAMADHFAGTPNVIGWQTDNEFGGPVCWCEKCRTSFHDWLKARYGSLDALNKAWGTHFWGHLYGAWEEIPLPDDVNTHNPGLCLDHARFHSWLTVRFQADQMRIIRQACPQHFITHNLMGLFCDLDYWELARDLDFVSWDNYPVWGPPGFHWDAAMAADVMRGLKRKNFWIIEQTAGPGGWGAMGRNPRPGEIRQIAFQQVAHGADGMVWFRWRTCTAGREQYWHGLLGHDGVPGRRYNEASTVARELHALAPLLEGTTVRTPVAMVYDYESTWAFRIQPAYMGEMSPQWDGRPHMDGAGNYQNSLRRWHQALLRAGIGVDMVRPGADLSGYRAVFAPHLYVMPDRTASWLSDFVQAGGTLVTDLRTGVKDETSLCHARTLPGLLSETLGISIAEYEALPPESAYAVTANAPETGSFSARFFVDWVTPRGAKVLAGYSDWHMRDFAAVTRNRFGAGWAYYVGAVITEEAFYDHMLVDVLARAGITAEVKPPAGVEASVREGEGRKLLFLVNHTEEERTVGVPAGKDELLAGARTGDSLTLAAYGVAVVRLA